MTGVSDMRTPAQKAAAAAMNVGESLTLEQRREFLVEVVNLASKRYTQLAVELLVSKLVRAHIDGGASSEKVELK